MTAYPVSGKVVASWVGRNDTKDVCSGYNVLSLFHNLQKKPLTCMKRGTPTTRPTMVDKQFNNLRHLERGSATPLEQPPPLTGA